MCSKREVNNAKCIYMRGLSMLGYCITIRNVDFVQHGMIVQGVHMQI